MNAPFRSQRTFHDSRGWFVNLRPEDAGTVADTVVPGQRLIDQVGLVVGPFIQRDDLQTWLDGYLARHASDRDAEPLSRAA
jgi:hypothetical protein